LEWIKFREASRVPIEYDATNKEKFLLQARMEMALHLDPDDLGSILLLCYYYIVVLLI
jgi:hypothetical protein